MEFAYTVGHTQSYDLYLSKASNPLKKGRYDDYPGGWIWRTVEEARKFLARNDLEELYQDMDSRKFSVYELELPTSWEVDVTSVPDQNGIHHLIPDAIILRKVL